MKPTMTSLERVRATVRGLPVDRVPVFLWINAHTGAQLMAEYRPSSHPHWNLAARWFWRRFQQRGGMDASELDRLLPLLFDIHTFNWANLYGLDLGGDLFLAAPGTPWHYARIFRRNGHFMMRDLFGVERAMGGIYPDMVGPPIRDLESLRAYTLPDLPTDKLCAPFRRLRRLYPGASIAAEIWGPQDFTATSLFGMERFMLFLLDYPEEMHRFLSRWTDWWVETIRGCAAAGADTIAILDDYGYDRRPLLSMPMWKEFTWPLLRRLVDAAREAGAMVMLHSCGYQTPFLPFYVEAGIDMLQSFQPQAGNDFGAAYGQYGDRLTFITGIDIQRGESMRPEALAAEIVANYRLAGCRGRHILGTTHEIQYTMPRANLMAILDTVRSIQAGMED